MIPHGIYLLTADAGKGNVAGGTVNSVTQSAFNPPLVVTGVVTEAPLPKAIEDRPDAAILEMKDLGDNVFYGG